VDFFVEDSDANFFIPFGSFVEAAEGVAFEPFEGGDSVSGVGSDLEGREVEVVLDFVFFFPGSSSDSRARFFPFFAPSSTSSGIGTRVKPSHLPPSSSSSLQLHIGRLALELVLMCID